MSQMPLPKLENPMVNAEQAAELLCVSRETLRRWRAEGRGPKWFVFHRRYIRYRIADIEAYMSANCSSSGQ